MLAPVRYLNLKRCLRDRPVLGQTGNFFQGWQSIFLFCNAKKIWAAFHSQIPIKIFAKNQNVHQSKNQKKLINFFLRLKNLEHNFQTIFSTISKLYQIISNLGVSFYNFLFFWTLQSFRNIFYLKRYNLFWFWVGKKFTSQSKVCQPNLKSCRTISCQVVEIYAKHL